MATHAHSTSAPNAQATNFVNFYPVATREAIENQIEALIAFLDVLDGDPDIEDDDPAGTEEDKGERREYYPLPPKYGLDQSEDPINLDEIMRDHNRRMMTDPTYCA